MMSRDRADVKVEIDRLEQKVEANPGDLEARRALGGLYAQTGRSDEALSALRPVQQRMPGDAKTAFFLGLAHEKAGRRDSALAYYGRYRRAPAGSDFRRALEGRYRWVSRQQARADIRRRLERERRLDGSAASPRTVAVVPFDYTGSRERYAALGRGIGELVLNDLSNVGRLQVVERFRLQALMDELKLGRSAYVADSTAPRVGYLLGARRLVGGRCAVLGGDGDRRIQVGTSIIDVASLRDLAGGETQTRPIDALADLVDEIVFDVVDRLGVELTAEERRDIEAVPTRSLQAFLAFSRGLEAEDRGNYRRAARLYRQAADIDPGFEAAGRRREGAQSLSAAGGPPDGPVVAAGEAVDLKNVRLDNLGASGARPDGDDTGDDRNPAAEATDARGDLPPPPPLPERGGQ
jgi:tetratricopeptide (TPR) repeat protein